jgi:methyl-accepting chemotaxis protein
MTSSYSADFNTYGPYLGVVNELCSNTLQRHEEFKGRVKAELDYEEMVLKVSAHSSNIAEFSSCAKYHQELIQSRTIIVTRTKEEHQRAQQVSHDLKQLNQKINLAYRKASHVSSGSQEARELESLLRDVNESIHLVDENIHKIERSFQELNKQVEVLQAAHPHVISVFGKIL